MQRTCPTPRLSLRSLPLLFLLAAACGSPAGTPRSVAAAPATGPALAPTGRAERIQALGEICFGDSPEEFARRVDADPGLRRRFAPLHEVDLPMGTYGLLPTFEQDRLVRLAIIGPGRTRDEASQLLQQDLDTLHDWIERQHGESNWGAPMTGEAALRPRREARWDLEDRVLTLGVSAQDVLLRAELRIERTRSGPAGD